MKLFAQALLTWMLFSIAACTENPGYHAPEYKEVKFEGLQEDIKVPAKAWDMIEMKTSGASEPALPLRNLVFSEVTVFLVEKNSGIVEGKALKITLPKGGGTIDLSRFITSKRGSFYVGFDFSEFEGATDKKVVFVSGTRKRKIGHEVFGAGCNQFFDITERFFKEMKGEGLRVNTTQERYVSVLGGTFLFAAQKEKNVHVAHVTFRHPQFSPLFCEEQ